MNRKNSSVSQWSTLTKGICNKKMSHGLLYTVSQLKPGPNSNPFKENITQQKHMILNTFIIIYLKWIVQVSTKNTLDILKKYLHAENKVSRSRLLKVRHADRGDRYDKHSLCVQRLRSLPSWLTFRHTETQHFDQVYMNIAKPAGLKTRVAPNLIFFKSGRGRIWDCRSDWGRGRGWSRMFLSRRPRLHHIT